MKDAFGKDFLVEMQVSGEEDDGLTIEDIVTFAKLAEGYIDILQLRAGDGDLAHPTGFNSKPHDPLTLQYAAAIKASGAKIITAPIGGFQNLDDMESYIAQGKTDMIGLGRAFICDTSTARRFSRAGARMWFPASAATAAMASVCRAPGSRYVPSTPKSASPHELLRAGSRFHHPQEGGGHRRRPGWYACGAVPEPARPQRHPV